MLQRILNTTAVGLLASALWSSPLQLMAQTTNKQPATAKAGASDQSDASARKRGHPFHGKLAAVDQTAKTIKVGESVYQITSQTRITKAGKPATLADGVVGEEAAGFVKPGEDGNMMATSVRFGPKPDSASSAKKKEQAQKQ